MQGGDDLRIAGLDIGFALNRKTSGVALMGRATLSLGREFGGYRACARILADAPFDVVAIDGPIVPEGCDAFAARAVERLFASGLFQRRCKPGFSHVTGTGLMLRKAAGDAADWLAGAAPLGRTPACFPTVRAGAVVEAFPNAFLGVCLSESTYRAMPALHRGRKFDWLFERWVEDEIVARLPFLSAKARDLQRCFEVTTDHEERAALVCALTAWAVARGDFTAVGDQTGGWFFLPPWPLWQSWAREAVESGIRRLNDAGSTLRIEPFPTARRCLAC